MERLLRRYAKVTLALDKSGLHDLEHIMECSKCFLALSCQDALSSHPGSPALLQYSCDCTRSKVRKYASAQGTKVAKRSSVSSAAEFFVQQVELQFGKTMRALAAVANSFIDAIHLQGSRLGVTIVHLVHDRGLSARFKSCVSAMLEARAPRSRGS
eukprot:3417990-Amphidinium_carterae.1